MLRKLLLVAVLAIYSFILDFKFFIEFFFFLPFIVNHFLSLLCKKEIFYIFFTYTSVSVFTT